MRTLGSHVVEHVTGACGRSIIPKQTSGLLCAPAHSQHSRSSARRHLQKYFPFSLIIDRSARRSMFYLFFRPPTMGNQHSNSSSTTFDNRRPFARGVGGGNALGISRSELDRRCQSSGLYDTCHWDDRAIRKLIGDGKAAARCKGVEDRTPQATHECPICFLYYEEINTTKCCHASVCTECFLQVRPQKEKEPVCPFCNQSKFHISRVAKKLTEQEILDREKEEQQVNDARIRARSAGNDSTSSNGGDGAMNRQPIQIQQGADLNNGFGSSLERDSRVAMSRKRSESFASSERSEHEAQSLTEASMIQHMAMTPDERRRLEAEMRNQNSHPLALQMETEAHQRARQNERNYNRSHSHNSDRRLQRLAGAMSSSSSRRRGRGQSSDGGGGPRDWNQIVEAFENGGNGAITSLDDLVVLEAAILLSMEEEARHANGEDDDDNYEENGGDFDAAGHARDGFPLVRSFLASRGRDGEAATQQQVQNLARSLQSSSRRRPHLLRSGHGSQSARVLPQSALDTAALLMRGVSEEEQLAMAIAASLQDNNESSNNSNSENEESNENNTEEEAAGETAAQTADQQESNTEETPTTAIHAVAEGNEETEHDEHDDDVGEQGQGSIASSPRQESQSSTERTAIPAGVDIGVVDAAGQENSSTGHPVSPGEGAVIFNGGVVDEDPRTDPPTTEANEAVSSSEEEDPVPVTETKKQQAMPAATRATCSATLGAADAKAPQQQNLDAVAFLNEEE